MLKTYTYPRFDYVRPPELDTAAGADAATAGRYPVTVVGAGPVGLAAAIDLAVQGQRVLLLDNDDTVSIGSRGVCYAKRTLEVLDRLGCGQPCVDKGTSWDVGRTFFGEREVFSFNLRPQDGHDRPGMVNLQQYYLEEYLMRRARELPNLEIRHRNNVMGVSQDDDSVTLRVETPDGAYTLRTGWLVAADGARSPLRHMLGLEIDGKIFMDRFLIADVVMQADFPAERWFWFDPPFHPGQSVLLHKQADQVWRIDFQLGWQADPEFEKRPENVIPRIRAMLGDERPFELEWVSVYTFQCRRMAQLRHGRVLFAGDSAHQVSPFGARGANSGIQDADNLAWKLNLVLRGQAPATLLDSYTAERGFAADENIANSTRSTDFITPKSAVSKTFRNAVLQLAAQHPFARVLVNSGRLSVPSWLDASPLNTPDSASGPDAFGGDMCPGAPASDAPVQVIPAEAGAGKAGADNVPWLLRHLGGAFQLVYYVGAEGLPNVDMRALEDIARWQPLPVQPVLVAADAAQARNLTGRGFTVLHDVQGHVRQWYDLRPGTCYLLRPDQHVAARWRKLDQPRLHAALLRATGHATEEA